jgi:ABC-type phosphate/phosphonate transport system substrate-binding protein
MYIIGYMKNIFNDVDINDAQAAIKVWIKEILKDFNYSKGYDLKAKIYLSIDELNEDLKNGHVALLSLNTLDYLNLGAKIGLEPAFVPIINGKNIGAEYYLLVRDTNKYKSIKDLKGGVIGISTDQNHTASRLWLDLMLAKNKLPDKVKFFDKVIAVQKQSQLLLNLFFGQIDACIVDDDNFKLMSELNPQIEEKLTSILTSPRYLQGLLCFTKYLTDTNDREIFRSGIKNVTQFSSGKQILSLIKVSGLDPFKSEYLETYKDLLKEYNKLERKRIK